VTCLEVRDRLTESSLGVLSRTDAREVERHLEWCPGCRKEASELLDGATAVALSLPPAEPPSSLEGRIVERFRMATGRTPTPSRTRLLVLVAAALTAGFLALGSLGWAVAQRGRAQSLEQLVTEARKQNKDLLEVISGFKGAGRTLTATLQAPGNARGFGTAIIFSAPKEGFVLVDIPVPPASKGPFVLQLVDGRKAIDAGQLNPAAVDRLVLLKWFTDVNLGGVVTVTVIDQSTGAVALTGALQPYTG
jgi:Putative zinc-finger